MKFTPKFLSRIASLAGIAVAAALLTGCAATGGAATTKFTPEQMQKRAAERSTARWKALTDKRFGEVFGYLSEASRLGTTANEYEAAMQRMGYVAASLVSVDCDDSICNVKTNITLPVYVRNIGARKQTFPVDEQWTVQNGELWLIRR